MTDTPILSRTINFFQLYRHICGESEVPDIYHFWSTVSLLAATVEDRVWYEKFKHEQLFANLFILLVGPSGLGKGTAISQLLRLAESGISINRYRGRVTGAHLIDYLGKPTKDEWGQKYLANPKLWLIMDELQNDVSTNKRMVEDFIYLMTELYTASNYKIQTGTREHGQVNIERPIVNWLAGTNEDDLREILTTKLMRSGFTARTCFVFGNYDFDKRCPRIIYPDDYEEVFQHLCYRLWILQRTQGPFLVTEVAEAELDKWYMKRPEPDEELLYSAWRRHHDLLLKFAMTLCLADGGPMVLQHKHVIQAKQMVAKIYQFSEMLIVTAGETDQTKPSNDIARYIKKKKEVKHTDAVSYFRQRRGMNSTTFKRAVFELLQEGVVVSEEVNKTGRGRSGTMYYWKGGYK